MLSTSVEVRDDRGCVITAGQGQLFIGRGENYNTFFKKPTYMHFRLFIEWRPPVGGQERVCLIDDESTMVPGTMRATGDWVQLDGSQLHYLGRRDRLVKRNGQRVNLDTVQQVRVLVCFFHLVSLFCTVSN